MLVNSSVQEHAGSEGFASMYRAVQGCFNVGLQGYLGQAFLQPQGQGTFRINIGIFKCKF